MNGTPMDQTSMDFIRYGERYLMSKLRIRSHTQKVGTCKGCSKAKMTLMSDTGRIKPSYEFSVMKSGRWGLFQVAFHKL